MEMLDGIVSFFNQILTIIRTGFNALFDLVKGLGKMLEWLYNILGFAIDIIETMPNWIKGFLLLSVGISTILLIAGRAGGKSA